MSRRSWVRFPSDRIIIGLILCFAHVVISVPVEVSNCLYYDTSEELRRSWRRASASSRSIPMARVRTCQDNISSFFRYNLCNQSEPTYCFFVQSGLTLLSAPSTLILIGYTGLPSILCKSFLRVLELANQN